MIIFIGKELDNTGLYYYSARYYDPQLGRFISADTVVQSPFDPQSLNRYAYCRNNPVKYTDPTGHWWFIVSAIISIVKAAAASAIVQGAFIGAVLGAGVAAATGGDIGRGALFGGIGGAVFSFAGQLANGMVQMASKSSVLADLAGNIVGGAASGAAVAGASGGNVGNGASLGALGGLGFYCIGKIPYGGFGSIAHMGLSAALGGGISKLAGGDFGEGAAIAGAISFADCAYRSVMDMREETKGGKASMETATKDGKAKISAVKEQLTVVNTDGSNNCGFQTQEGEAVSFFSETSRSMNWLGKNVPGIEGTARFHDIVTYRFSRLFGETANAILFNVQSMVPAYTINMLGSMAERSVLVTEYALQGD